MPYRPTRSTLTSFRMERMRIRWNVSRAVLSDYRKTTSRWWSRNLKMTICEWINSPDKWNLFSQSTISYHQKEKPPLHSMEAALKRISRLRTFHEEPPLPFPHSQPLQEASIMYSRGLHVGSWFSVCSLGLRLFACIFLLDSPLLAAPLLPSSLLVMAMNLSWESMALAEAQVLSRGGENS